MKELYQILVESGASDFLIRETNTISREAFFIGQKLDMGRAKNVTHTFVTVYVDSEDKKFRGSATKELHPTASPDEMKKEVEDAIFAARFVKNPWYPLAEEAKEEIPAKEIDLNEELIQIVKAMQAVTAKANEKINSYEVFVNQKRTHIRNSKGVDVSFSSLDCHLEVVINASKDGHEIELIKELRFSDKDASEITSEVEKMFESGHQRLDAVPTRKNEHGSILLSGDDVVSFFEYFTAHTNAGNQYMGVAKAKIGEKMTGEEADPLTIKTLRQLSGSTKNAPYDGDGNRVEERTLFEDGVCQAFWGSIQHAHYLGLENTTSINNVIVSGGSMSEEELRALPHLEITDFSDFQVDPVTGNFGGEIRLGYESDGKTQYPVTTGSISGNCAKSLLNVKFSKETRQINNFVVPSVVLLTDVSVAGA